MKAMLVINNKCSVKELVGILTEDGYKVTVEKTGNYWEHKYMVIIEVSKDESDTCD